MTAAWGSQMYVYLPTFSFTVHVAVPVNATPVVLATPGPTRWKLWIADLSLTRTTYVPCLSFLTILPALLSVMVKPGPSVATRIVAFGAAWAPDTAAVAVTASAASASLMR